MSSAMTAGCAILGRSVMSAVLVALAPGQGPAGPRPGDVPVASRGSALISTGAFHTCAIEAGKAYCWGDDTFGELGDGSTFSSSVPVPVDTSGVLAGKTLTEITTGFYDTCALDSTGAAYCWGYGPYGELGDGSAASSTVPVAVDTRGALAGKTLAQISGTGGGQSINTCALDSAGAAYCWGVNDFGELGDGRTGGSSDVPVAVVTSGALAGKTVTQISAGYDHQCAVDAAGAAYCWGYDGFGELGNGRTGSSNVPVGVVTSGALAGKTLAQVSASWYHTCAVDTTGAAYCWGENFGDSFGVSGVTQSSVPVPVDTSGVLSGKILTQLTAGQEHTCALDSTGAAYCWGSDAYGQLGDGSAGGPGPVAVDTSGVLAGKTLTQISAGYGHTCALDSSGAIYCWGDNTQGELGDDSTAQSDVPVLAGPQAPSGVTAAPGDATTTVSWAAPASLDGGTLTGYIASASPGGQTCTTTGATTCIITGLANGTTYSIAVVAHTTVGASGVSAPASVTPGRGVAFTSDPSETVTFGVAFSFTVTTSGSPPPRITKSGKLPPRVRFTPHNDGTATIAGTPRGDAGGVYSLTLTAKNRSGTATQAFTLTVNRAPVLKKTRTLRAKVGAAVDWIITAKGYPVPALTESGPLPVGLTFTDNGNGTAAITGTPAAGSGGRYSITVTATNSLGSTSHTFTLKVR